MAIVERVRAVVAPIVEAASADLYDIEHHGATVRVLVDSEGGIDLDSIARLSRSVSRALDHHDVIAGRYTLEVSSPGLERPLRTPDHFRRAAGSRVKVKTLPGFDGPRRLAGVLESVGDHGIEVRDDDGAAFRVGYRQLASARTVFDWDRRGQQRRPLTARQLPQLQEEKSP